MTEDVYERLAQQLEAQPEGLPRNENGLEMKILRRIFTEEEAEIRTHMRLLPAPAQEIAKRLGRDPEEMATKLERMVENGQIYGFGPRGNRTYSASPFMFGIYQFQLNRLDPELVELAKQYVDETWGAAQSAMTPKNMRVIPVNVGVEAESQALPYDDARTTPPNSLGDWMVERLKERGSSIDEIL